MNRSPRKRFVLTVEDIAPRTDSPAVRLRLMVKQLLRTWNFRLLDAREVPGEEVPATEERCS
jgi:hypothetical protein